MSSSSSQEDRGSAHSRGIDYNRIARLHTRSQNGPSSLSCVVVQATRGHTQRSRQRNPANGEGVTQDRSHVGNGAGCEGTEVGIRTLERESHSPIGIRRSRDINTVIRCRKGCNRGVESRVDRSSQDIWGDVRSRRDDRRDGARGTIRDPRVVEHEFVIFTGCDDRSSKEPGHTVVIRLVARKFDLSVDGFDVRTNVHTDLSRHIDRNDHIVQGERNVVVDTRQDIVGGLTRIIRVLNFIAQKRSVEAKTRDTVRGGQINTRSAACQRTGVDGESCSVGLTFDEEIRTRSGYRVLGNRGILVRELNRKSLLNGTRGTTLEVNIGSDLRTGGELDRHTGKCRAL